MNRTHIIKFIIFFSAFFIHRPFCFGQSGFVETIYFKSNSSTINKKYTLTLNSIAKKLSSDTFSYLKIFGFADKKGSKNYNDTLSGKRADAVYNYLASRSNFDTTRIYITWLGESADIYDLHFPGAHKQQRCVDIWIQFYDKKKHDNLK